MADHHPTNTLQYAQDNFSTSSMGVAVYGTRVSMDMDAAADHAFAHAHNAIQLCTRPIKSALSDTTLAPEEISRRP